MDLFELLIIAAFILFPILEGVLKQRRKGSGPGESGQGPGRQGRGESRQPGTRGPSERRSEPPRSAADMLPDDLWELMTGEKRPRTEETEGPDAPWSTAPGGATGTATSEGETGPEPEPWTVDDEATAPEPVSLEYEGPEAYSLETPAPEPQSLEQPIPSPSARHRAFHERIDRPERRVTVRTSPLIRSLATPRGLRQAVLAREILGPPKGLE